MSSSATTALSRRPLKEVLEGVADPGDRRGVRHALTAVLCLAVVGVLAGCRTLGAMREHVADLEPADLGDLDLEEGRALPSESTIRRVLQRVNADDLDARVSSWLRTRVGAIGGRRVIAVEDETMRGARGAGERAPHLPAAPGRAGGVVVGQRRVADKSNEIPALRDLLEPLDPGGAVITADAMHTQRGTAEWIISRGAHYLLTVKDNQPGLKRELEKLPWKDVPSTSVPDGSHGRRVRRTIKAVEAPAWIDFPGAAQVIRIRRTRTVKGRKHIEVVHLICSLPPTDARPEQVAAWARGHWTIENRLHWVRDVVFDEDRHQLRTANGPQIMAALRNLAISLIRLLHGPRAPIAATTRAMARRPRRAIDLITRPPQ